MKKIVRLCGELASAKKLVVIVGAGVSTEAGLPTGEEMIERILREPGGQLVRRQPGLEKAMSD